MCLRQVFYDKTRILRVENRNDTILFAGHLIFSTCELADFDRFVNSAFCDLQATWES